MSKETGIVKKQLNQEEYIEYIKQWKINNRDLIDSGKCKKVFMENLPKKKKLNELCIKWDLSVNYNVYFIYNNLKGNIKILNEKGKKIIIQYKHREYIIGKYQFKRCGIGRILNEKTSEFKVDVGNDFKDDNRDLIIINKKYKKDKNGRNFKYYNYLCNRCTWNEGWIEESNLLKGIGCGCCHGRITVKGINDITTTNPEMVKYFVNIEDAHTHTYSSNQKVLMKCPDCGAEKEMIISNLFKRGFVCAKCSDGVPFTEKLMFNVLQQLLNRNFIYQYSKTNTKWCEKYSYDFYFKYNNEEYIIETHGMQHYENAWEKLERTQKNDRLKKELAIKNGIKAGNYIVIDCRYSDFKYIKESILKSQLNKIFNLSQIDWTKCGEFICSNLIKIACNYKKENPNLTTEDIKKLMNGYNRCTIRDWLKIGNELEWCVYNSKEEMKRISSKLGRESGKSLKIYKNNKCLGIFESIAELGRKSKDILNTKLDKDYISKTCKANKQYKGYTFEYTTKEEFYNSIDNENDTYKLYA